MCGFQASTSGCSLNRTLLLPDRTSGLVSSSSSELARLLPPTPRICLLGWCVHTTRPRLKPSNLNLSAASVVFNTTSKPQWLCSVTLQCPGRRSTRLADRHSLMPSPSVQSRIHKRRAGRETGRSLVSGGEFESATWADALEPQHGVFVAVQVLVAHRQGKSRTVGQQLDKADGRRVPFAHDATAAQKPSRRGFADTDPPQAQGTEERF